jgi:hypothetical protein
MCFGCCSEQKDLADAVLSILIEWPPSYSSHVERSRRAARRGASRNCVKIGNLETIHLDLRRAGEAIQSDEVNRGARMMQVLNAARTAGLGVFYALHHRYRPGDYETWKYIAPVQKAAWSGKTVEYGTWVASSAANRATAG